MSMTIRKKLNLSSLFILGMVVILSGVGLFGIYQLSNSLEFITQKAWNAADGSMESEINVLTEVSLTKSILARNVDGSETQKMADAEKEGGEALGRAIDSGLFDSGTQAKAQTLLQAFQTTKKNLLEKFYVFLAAEKEMNREFSQFQKLMTDVEEMGDGQVEDLEKNPRKRISWNSGLAQKWEAADGAMESQIFLLERFYNYQLLVSGGKPEEILPVLAEKEKDLQTGLKRLAILKVFRTKRPAWGTGKTYSTMLREASEAHVRTISQAVASYLQSKKAEESYTKAETELLEFVVKMEVEGDEKVEGEEVRVRSVINFSYISISIVALVSFLATFFFSIFMNRSINLPIRKVMEGLNTSSDQVTSASGQVAASSQSLAEGASEQAASLEEVSASLEEISGMARQNADNTNQNMILAKEVEKDTETSTQSMQRMTGAINEIKVSSDEMAKIIKTIDEIAFQTNLLALNAAVEAARAGDSGKGFAVVAEEVRNLARRSAEAAQSTGALIEENQTKADAGVGLAQEVEGALGQIKTSVEKMAGLVEEVTETTKQQADGVLQVVSAIEQMDKVTQANAANAEETAAASQELSAQALGMSEFVGQLAVLVEEKKNGQGAFVETQSARIKPIAVTMGGSMPPARSLKEKIQASSFETPRPTSSDEWAEDDFRDM